MSCIFVTGIGTDVGKTFVAAALVLAKKANYWKPIQSGSPTDSDFIEKLLGRNCQKIFKETFKLREPLSPHASASLQGIKIKLTDFKLPASNAPLVVEGAGGVLVPISEDFLVIDLIEKLQTPTLIVSKHYLGSINHTLLTIDALRRRKISIKGIVYNGTDVFDNEEIIEKLSGIKKIATIPTYHEVNLAALESAAKLLAPLEF
jgi:dethiobiotin synthetase